MGRSQAPLCCGCCQMVGGRQGARPCLRILCFPVVLLQVAFRQIIYCSQASGCANCRSPWPLFDFALIGIFPSQGNGSCNPGTGLPLVQGLDLSCPCTGWSCHCMLDGWQNLLPHFLSSRHKLLIQPFLVMTRDFKMCRLFASVLFSFTFSVSSLVGDSSSKFHTRAYGHM